jgi:hypothetical protein
MEGGNHIGSWHNIKMDQDMGHRQVQTDYGNKPLESHIVGNF